MSSKYKTRLWVVVYACNSITQELRQKNSCKLKDSLVLLGEFLGQPQKQVNKQTNKNLKKLLKVACIINIYLRRFQMFTITFENIICTNFI